MSKKSERVELNHLLNEEGGPRLSIVTEVGGSVAPPPPSGPQPVRGGDFSFAVPSIGRDAVAGGDRPSLLRKVTSGN